MQQTDFGNHTRTLGGLTAIVSLLVLVGSFSCVTREEEKTRDAARDLRNGTTSFIYNAIPRSPGASISPEYSAAINTFAVRLLNRVYRDTMFKDRNVVLSPFSVSRSLAVLAEGASGTARAELLEALGGQIALNDAREALAELLYADNSVILQCADAVWIDSSRYSLNQSFRTTVNSKYGVECSCLDFSDRAEAVGTINTWISTNTSGYLKEAVDHNTIHPNTALLLTNAVYFEADWASPFEVTKTRSEPFHSPDGTVSVPMMTSGYRHETRKTENWENAKLYYGTTDKDFFYLDVYMPTAVPVEGFLEEGCLSALSGGDSTMAGGLRMPKFSLTRGMDLVPMLKQMGIREIFDPANTDLGAIARYGGDTVSVPLYVDMIRHVAGIETDEEGTKAYAVTVTYSGIGAAGPSSPDVVLDNPFVYFIRAGENGLILFAGVVNDPNAD